MTPKRTSPRRTSKRQRMLTAGLLSGGAAGLLLIAPSLADAASPLADVFGQTTPPTTELAADSADDSAASDTATDEAADAIEIAEPGDHLRAVLQPLVDDGTITAEQLDAIVESVQSAAPHVFMDGMPQIFEGGPGFPVHGRPDGQFPDVMGGGPHGPGVPGGGMEIHAGGPGIAIAIGDGVGGGRFGGYALDVIANTIGITAPDLVDQLADGSTVAEIATSAGADPEAVIDALVADAQERLAAAVQSGRITQAVADERIEDTTERITNFVNGTEQSTDGESVDAGTEESTETASTATTETTTA